MKTTLAHLAPLIGAEDQGKAAALPYPAWVGRCCRNALIYLPLLLAAAPLRAQPDIIMQPQSQTVRVGETVFFTAAATGAPPLAYQWRKDGVDLAGATNADHVIPQSRAADAGRYTVMVSDAFDQVTSDAATLVVQYVVQFSAARFSVWETGRVAVIRVRRGDDGPDTVTVIYATSDGTATAEQDYTATSGTLTFGPGESEKSFTIPLLDDAFPEGAETLRLSLSGLTGPAVFGANTNAQVTIIDDEPSSAPGIRTWPVIAARGTHTVALKADGSLWAWGYNNYGQLGIGDGPHLTNVPTRVGSDHDWATVAVGANHTLAVKTGGSLWAWGDGGYGQLGIGADFFTCTNIPTRIGTESDWVMVTAGDDYSLGLKVDGSLWAWGWNAFGQLGLGDATFQSANVPVRVGEESDWAWVSAGYRQSFAIKKNGSLWAWGENYSGQLGIGLSNGTGTPSLVDSVSGSWAMVRTTGGHGLWSFADSLGIAADGTLWAWGVNREGQLGLGSDTEFGHRSPVQVGLGDDWSELATGSYHKLALKADGTLWSWGWNGHGELGIGDGHGDVFTFFSPLQVNRDDDWVAVGAGYVFSVGVKSDGSLWSWGGNSVGQLGLGLELYQITNVPTRIGTDNDWAQPPSAFPMRGEFRITAQSINVDHSRTLFFTDTNSRAYYVLYRGDSLTNITTPVDAALARAYPSLTDRTPPATNATAFYRIRAVPRAQPLDLDRDGIDDYYELRHAAFLHPLNPADAALDYDGDGYSNLSEYRAGTDPSRPTVRHSIASGLAHTVVLKQDGSLWAWGDNTYGQLGDGTDESRAEPVRVGADTDWSSVSAGRDSQYGDHTVALKRDGSLWAWGANYWGQRGHTPEEVPSTNVPVRVGNFSAWMDVSAGGGFTAALQRNGSLWVWGNNNFNVLPQCCNPSWTSTPTRVGWDWDWVTLAAGGTHILALKADRSLWAWGDNTFGQCGLGEGVSGGNAPTRVGTDNDWIAIAASGDSNPFNGAHSLGLKADGTLWSWGQDKVGELGLDASDFNQFTPARVGTDSDWATIGVGAGTSLARKRDGSLWAWGLGIGSIPTPASMRHDWRDFAAGGAAQHFPNFATAVASDGTLWQWRFDQSPQQVGPDSDWGSLP